MEYDDIETIEEVVEMGSVSMRVKTTPHSPRPMQLLKSNVKMSLSVWRSILGVFDQDDGRRPQEGRSRTHNYPGVNTNTARHIYGVQGCRLRAGLLMDECPFFRTPSVRRGRSPNRDVCPACVIRCGRNQSPGAPQEELDAVAGDVNRLTAVLGRETDKAVSPDTWETPSTRNHLDRGRFWLE